MSSSDVEWGLSLTLSPELVQELDGETSEVAYEFFRELRDRLNKPILTAAWNLYQAQDREAAQAATEALFAACREKEERRVAIDNAGQEYFAARKLRVAEQNRQAAAARSQAEHEAAVARRKQNGEATPTAVLSAVQRNQQKFTRQAVQVEGEPTAKRPGEAPVRPAAPAPPAPPPPRSLCTQCGFASDQEHLDGKLSGTTGDCPKCGQFRTFTTYHPGLKAISESPIAEKVARQLHAREDGTMHIQPYKMSDFRKTRRHPPPQRIP